MSVKNNTPVRLKWTLHHLHQWAGLTAGLWLAVLGITGLLLDHRHEWRWLWQNTVSDKWLPATIVKKARTGVTRLYQIHPSDNRYQLAGGPQGLWWSNDNGGTWQPTVFLSLQDGTATSATPAISTIVIRNNAIDVWLATDNGLWLSRDFGRSAHIIDLNGVNITALAAGHDANTLLGVADRGRVFEFDTNLNSVRWLVLTTPESAIAAKPIDLSRWMHDLHFGRGFIFSPLDLWINDFTAAALLVLPLSGFLFWYLPRRWRRQKPHSTSAAVKKITMKSLLRLHSSLIGVALFIPIVYITTTGFFLDHGKELRAWMKSVSIPTALQTPVYSMRSWSGEIYAIAVYPHNPGRIALGTRLGLFYSDNSGASWQRDSDVNGFVWTLRQAQDVLIAGGMSAPNKVLNNGRWHIAKESGHMPTDVTIDADGNWYWTETHGVRSGKQNAFKHANIGLPTNNGVPWFYVLDALHNGSLFSEQWKWVNDVFAALALFLVVSGLIRWWRFKWV